MFDLEDASDDGTIDAEEFSIVCSCYGLDKAECQEAFRKMSQGEEEVDRDQFAVLWQQFFSSDDPSSPGNFIFGKTSF
jgi:Ca2+-binding EF-hand superfamily protein